MQTGLIIIIILLIIFIIWTLIEQKLLVTTIYSVTSAKLPEAFHNTSFVVLSDLHNYVFGRNNTRLVKRINELSPKFIIIAGDMINKKSICYPSNAFSLIEQLSKKYKIYYAYGNHEQKMEKLLSAPVFSDRKNVGSSWIKYKKILTDLKVVFLDNKSILYENKKDKLRITGVSLQADYFKHGKQIEMEDGYLNKLLGEKPEGLYEILIAHNPIYFHNYLEWGADLTISGHLHGGLVRLPLIGGLISPQVLPFPKYDSGVYKENEQQMIVSRGLGSHSLMPRVFNVPQIVCVTLRKK